MPTGQITIRSMIYSGTLTVRPGERVTVANSDPEAHTLTSRTGLFDTGTIAGGRQGSFTAPTKPGSYPFGCNFHPGMAGTLVVS